MRCSSSFLHGIRVCAGKTLSLCSEVIKSEFIYRKRGGRAESHRCCRVSQSPGAHTLQPMLTSSRQDLATTMFQERRQFIPSLFLLANLHFLLMLCTLCMLSSTFVPFPSLVHCLSSLHSLCLLPPSWLYFFQSQSFIVYLSLTL